MRKRICCIFLCCILLALLPGKALAFSPEHADSSPYNNAYKAAEAQVKATMSEAVRSRTLAVPVPFATVIESGVIGTSGGASGAPWRLYDDGRLIVDAGTGAINFPTGPVNSPLIAHNALIYEIIFSEPIIAGPSLAGLFLNLSNVHTITGLDYIDTSAVTSMARMFEGTPSLVNIDDLSGWNTGNVTTMTRMFFGASSLTSLDVSDWDTENVTNMYCMFLNASSLTSLDLSAWETGNVTSMGRMFEGTSSLTTIGDVTNWNTGNVWHMGNLFWNASSLTSLDLSGWDTGNVTVMSSMFRNTSSLIELNVLSWNTENVTGMSNMFLNASALTRLDLSSWDTTSVTSTGMTTMFTAATSLRELTLGTGWHTANTPGLPNPQSASPYTGFWTNIGNGNIYVPEGNYTLTSAQLMNNANAAYRVDTWIWQRQYPMHVVTFVSADAAMGTVTPDMTGAEPNNTISSSLAVFPAPALGYKFLHWVSSDPAHNIGGSLTTPELHELIITQNTTFTAYFSPLPPNTHLVIFILDGGYVDGYPDPLMIIIYDNDTITVDNVPVPNHPTRPFLGWRENGTGQLLSNEFVGNLVVTGLRNFTAQWGAKSPTGNPEYPDPYPDPDPDPSPGSTPGQSWNHGSNQDSNQALQQPPELGTNQETDINFERQAYLIGTDEGLIRPNANITRAEVATIFFRLITDQNRTAYWMQTNPFSDVELQNWFNNAVSTMSNANVFAGFPNGTFAPNQTITRAEMTAVIVRFMGGANGYMTDNHFNDISGHWAADYINTAAVNSWVQGPHGMGGAFYPDLPITRAQAAAMINRIFSRLVESTQDLLPDMITWPDNADTSTWYYLYIQSATNSYTFRWRETYNQFESWVAIIPAPDWTVLERPDSRPGDTL